MSLFFKKDKCNERGSIMLEVIAVLALMGVMGAMLFRQIYQRNQELHNIQMASEIRTIKEAFAAYIQAERSELLNSCTDLSQPYNLCDVSSTNLAGNENKGIRSYLPAGWFSDNDLQRYYTFSLWAYKQNDVTSKTILYGVIVPTELTLPSTGWNMKRAARVALLIGADGGVYQAGITDDALCPDHKGIAGSLGTWHLCMENAMCDGASCPEKTYVAITGMDIFTPEYELPEGKVTLPNPLDLATQKLHAWQQFSAGSANDTTCFTVGHNTGTLDADGVFQVNTDAIESPSNCKPLFWVDGTSNQVFVNNDLEIGAFDGTTPKANVTIRQEGPIAFNASVDDPQNPKTGVAGYNKAGYLLDPEYTSVMNDIKVMSRGGAKLSEILPKYILQTQQSIDKDHKTVTIPTCPKSYKAALAIFPVSWDQSATTTLKNNGAVITTSANGDFPVKSDDLPVTGSFSVSASDNLAVTGISGATGIVDKTEISDKLSVSGSGPYVDDNEVKAKVKADLSKLSATTEVTEGICVKITKGGDSTDTGIHNTDVNPTGSWSIILGHANSDANCSSFADDIKAIAQAYCVFDSSVTDMTPPASARKDQMVAAGTWDAFKTKIKTGGECRSYGGSWTGTETSGTCS